MKKKSIWCNYFLHHIQVSYVFAYEYRVELSVLIIWVCNECSFWSHIECADVDEVIYSYKGFCWIDFIAIKAKTRHFLGVAHICTTPAIRTNFKNIKKLTVSNL